MKVKVIGRVFGKGGELIPVGTTVERKSADGVFYEAVNAKPQEKTFEVATPKRSRKTTKSEDDE